MQVFSSFLQVAYTHFGFKKEHERKLETIFKDFNGISQNSRRRILNYVSYITLSNMWFATLRGYPVTPKEDECAVALAAASALYDELLDQYGYTHEEIIRHTEKPSGEHESMYGLLRRFDQILNRTLVNKDAYVRYYQRIIKSQADSAKQIHTRNLPIEEIRSISYDKGGDAMLVWRCSLENPLKPREEQAIYLMGVLLQLTNDIFDLYKDTQTGEQTLVSVSHNLFDFKREFTQLITQTISLYAGLDYPESNKKKMLLQMMVGLARGSVAIEQHTRLQGNETVYFEPKMYSRNQLICDMEKPSNVVRLIKMCLVWKKEIFAQFE